VITGILRTIMVGGTSSCRQQQQAAGDVIRITAADVVQEVTSTTLRAAVVGGTSSCRQEQETASAVRRTLLVSDVLQPELITSITMFTIV
jgi:hypothetical protein